MTIEEKFHKIIDKAVANGFSLKTIDVMKLGDPYQMTDIIFSHAFLKAYFGEATYKEKGLTYQWWTHHAQQLAITPEDKRIDYLWRFI